MVGGTTVGPAISIHALREEGDPFHARFRRWKADFYPRPPRGGRLDGWNAGLLTNDISIHALREEGDLRVRVPAVPHNISIHALREEGDSSRRSMPYMQHDFYPRPPRGGRRLRVMSKRGTWLFLSTPSARRATYGPLQINAYKTISIHALREEGDRLRLALLLRFLYFYPRPPRGGRPNSKQP